MNKSNYKLNGQQSANISLGKALFISSLTMTILGLTSSDSQIFLGNQSNPFRVKYCPTLLATYSYKSKKSWTTLFHENIVGLQPR